MNFDDELERLNRGELPPAPIPEVIPLGSDGLPIDPAQRVQFDRAQEHLLLDRREADRAALAVERREVEAHWARIPQAPTQGATSWGQPVVNVHVHFDGGGYGQPAYQPTWPVYEQGWCARNEAKLIFVCVAGCAIIALAFMWILAATFRYQGERDAKERAYYAQSSTVPTTPEVGHRKP